MKMRKTVLALTIACTPLLAAAQEAGGACRPDMQKFCKGVKPGEGRIVDCLVDRGGVVIIRPLILHASSAAVEPRRLVALPAPRCRGLPRNPPGHVADDRADPSLPVR